MTREQNENNKLSLTPLMEQIPMLEVKMEDFGIFISDLITQIGANGILDPRSINIRSKFILPSEALDLDSICAYGIPIIDYYLARKYNLQVTIDNSLPDLEPFRVKEALFAAFFLVITRNKFRLSEGEPMPRFLKDFLSSPMSNQEMIDVLCKQNIAKLPTNWVFSIKFAKLPIAVQTRLEMGIAGSRLFNAIRANKPDNFESLPANLKNVYYIISEIALKGPYIEMHPAVMSSSLMAKSIGRNLSSYMALIYSEGELIKMVENKYIFSVPKYDERYVSFNDWTIDTFSELRTPLSKILRPVVDEEKS